MMFIPSLSHKITNNRRKNRPERIDVLKRGQKRARIDLFPDAAASRSEGDKGSDAENNPHNDESFQKADRYAQNPVDCAKGSVPECLAEDMGDEGKNDGNDHPRDEKRRNPDHNPRNPGSKKFFNSFISQSGTGQKTGDPGQRARAPGSCICRAADKRGQII